MAIDIDIKTDSTAPPGVKYLKYASTVIVPIVAILGGVWALDSHYASAADVTQLQRSVENQVRSLKIERSEDEVFKLDMKKQAQGGKLSPEDAAIHERYLRKLNEAQRDQRNAERAIIEKSLSK